MGKCPLEILDVFSVDHIDWRLPGEELI